jgi:ribose transport system substrate-binding protein
MSAGGQLLATLHREELSCSRISIALPQWVALFAILSTVSAGQLPDAHRGAQRGASSNATAISAAIPELPQIRHILRKLRTSRHPTPRPRCRQAKRMPPKAASQIFLAIAIDRILLPAYVLAGREAHPKRDSEPPTVPGVPGARKSNHSPQEHAMRKHPLALLSVSAFALAALIAACAKPYHEDTEHYVFIATNINLPYWQQVRFGFEDAAKTLGVKGDLDGPATYDPDGELTAFRQAIDQHPAGICVSASRPELFRPEIDKAIAAGIPVICVDSDVPDSKRVLYVGTDNQRAGHESLKRMAAILSGKGNLVVISIPGQLNLDNRLTGVNEALKAYPGLKVAKVLDDKGDPRNAYDAISELVQKKEKVDGILCLEASGGAGAAGALHRFSMEGKLPIVAFDDDPETLDWIDRGAITATIAQKPYVMSYYGLKLLDDLHHNAVHQYKDWRTAVAAPMPTFVDTGTVVVDKNNLKLYREALAPHTQPVI